MQIDIKGDDGKTGNLDRVAGYDPDEFMVMELVGAGMDPKDDRTRRSHLGLLVTRRVNKIVLLPVLERPRLGRRHRRTQEHEPRAGQQRQPLAQHARHQRLQPVHPAGRESPVIRKKCVLHIMDGIKGVFQGGPAASRPDWTWENNALFFATDPVAMDHVAWRYVDAKRKEKGLPPVAAVGRTGLDPLKTEGFDIRQPQHIPLAAHLGLGIFDFDSPRGKRNSIQHRIIKLT